MPRARFIQRFCVIVGIVTITLASCGTPDQERFARVAASPVAPLALPTSAPDPVVHATPVPTTYATLTPTRTASPGPTAASTPTDPPTVTPLSTPMLPPHAPRVATTLPLDQPWIIGSGKALAVDNAGDLTVLDTLVRAVARPGKPPLLLTEGSDQVEVIDPIGWTRTPLALEPGTSLEGVVVSPDGASIAFRGTVQAGELQKTIFLIADLHTGTTRPIPVNKPFSAEEGWFAPDPIAWSGDLLFLHDWGSATSFFWRVDLANPQGTPVFAASIGATHYYAIHPNDYLLIAADDYIHEPWLVDLRTGTKVTTCHVAFPALAPDHLMMVYGESGQQNRVQLKTCDLRTGETTSLATLAGTDLHAWWSQDGRRIMVTVDDTNTVNAGVPSTFLFARDGTQIGAQAGVGLPEHSQRMSDDALYLPLTADDQLIVANYVNGHANVRALPFHTGDTPRFPPVWLPDSDVYDYEVVYVPSR